MLSFYFTGKPGRSTTNKVCFSLQDILYIKYVCLCKQTYIWACKYWALDFSVWASQHIARRINILLRRFVYAGVGCGFFLVVVVPLHSSQTTEMLSHVKASYIHSIPVVDHFYKMSLVVCLKVSSLPWLIKI